MKSPLQLLSPAMAGVLERIQRAARPPFHTLTPQQARAAYVAGAEVLDLPRAPLIRVEDIRLPCGDPQGDIHADSHANTRGTSNDTSRPARLYASSKQPLPVLLYLHGGGFVVGGLETHDSLCRQLALRSGAAVVALDYRLAPEHPFPAAVDDAWAAMQALANAPQQWGLRPGPIAVGGDSAGGTLAAACALHARDIGLKLALQLLITPGTTAHADTASHHFYANGFLLDSITIAWFFDHYIAHNQRSDWRFAPLQADVEGVAPACVLLAECDPLVDEGLAYADKLRAAGVAVNLELVRGMTHDFMKMGRVLKEAPLALDWAAAALRDALHP